MNITFLTLNVWMGGKLHKDIIRFVKKLQPDIINFQEVYNGKNDCLEPRYRTYRTFSELLKYPYTAFSSSFINIVGNDHIEFGNATFSKFPITTFNTTFYDIPFGTIREDKEADHSMQPRNLTRATIVVDKKMLNIFNTHGSWGINGNDTSRRLTMSEKIIAAVKNRPHTIVSGDFNTEPHTKTIKNIEKHMTNVFKDQLQTTFNLKQKKTGNFATSVVDHIFVSKDIKVIKKEVPQVNVSDHMPLVCTLQI